MRNRARTGLWGGRMGNHRLYPAAMLALTRDFARLDARLRQGDWESQWAVATPPPAPWPELAGKTLGILGYGRIGQCVARRAQAFDMAVWAIRRDPARSPTHGLACLRGPEALDEVLRQADYLVLTLSLTPATRGLVGERELHLLKPKMFHMCWTLSDGSSKLIPIDEQPNHQIVHLFRLGKAQRATHEPLHPGPKIDVLALDFLRMLLAHVVLLGLDMPLVGSPAIRVKPRDAKGLQELL